MDIHKKIQERKDLCVTKNSFVKSFTATSNDIKIYTDETGTYVRAKFASFMNIDTDKDRLHQGCFAKSFAERGVNSSTNRKIKLCWQHDVKDPIGIPVELYEKQDGAYGLFRVDNIDSVPNGKRLIDQIQSGTINQLSFGFSYDFEKMDWNEKDECFDIYNLDAFEISAVTFGANEQTEFVPVNIEKSKADKQNDRKKDENVSIFRKLGQIERKKTIFEKLGETINN